MTFRLLVAFLMIGIALEAEDFSLRHFGQGPVTLHTALTPEGKVARLVASATNDSGLPIEHARLCILATGTDGCLFELWNTGTWLPGQQLNWSVTTARKLPSLSHDATLTEFIAPTPQPVSTGAGAASGGAVTGPPEPRTTTQVPVTLQVSGGTSGSQFVLQDGTSVRSRLARNLSSASAKSGDTVEFEVMDDVKVGNYVIIQRGTMAMGTVTDALAKRSMGRSGHLDVTIDFVRSVSGEKIRLRGVQSSKGGGHVGAMTGAIVATSIVFFPAAPLFLFVKGKDTTLPKGQEVMIYVDGDYPLAPASTIQQPVASSGPASAQAPQLPDNRRQELAQAKPVKTGKALTNDDVLTLKAAAFGDEFIVNKIKSSAAAYSIEVLDLVKLKQAGLSEAVITAMMEAAR